MTAYYNESAPDAANWLRHLITENLIAPGDVDERSIVDVRPDELGGYDQHHFFAGIGGWSLALRLAGWPDNEPVWTGSCPCQPFSAAGRRKGFDDERHLWPEFRSLISERRPATVFGEQVAGAADWLRLVRSDLEAMEYAVGAMPIEAASAGADHLRDRFWFVADSQEQRRPDRNGRPLQGAAECERAAQQSQRCGGVDVTMGDAGGAGLALRSIAEVQRGDIRHEGAPLATASPGSLTVADADQSQRRIGDEQSAGQQPEQQPDQGARDSSEWVVGADRKIRRVKPGVRLLVDGFPARVGLLRGFGNAIDPRPAAQFIGAYIDVRR